MPKSDLANLRLACHDFSVRAAPALFEHLSITFRPNAFTKPTRRAALDRLGFFVKTLTFKFPHTTETFLPPLVDPETGAEMSFTYTPQLEPPTTQRPKYGDTDTTEILTRQYPALFHAATNVPAFIRAFSAFVNLQHLRISCPGHEPSSGFRRSIVDYALISLRIAVERNRFNAMRRLTIAPMHPGGLRYLVPHNGYGATPRSAKTWSRIEHLEVHLNSPSGYHECATSPIARLLQTYLRTVKANLLSFTFSWNGQKRLLSILRLRFPRIERMHVKNAQASAADISIFVHDHKATLREVEMEDVELTSGTWDDALSPVTRRPEHPRASARTASIPIMLAPVAARPRPATAISEYLPITTDDPARPSFGIVRWLCGKKGKSRCRRESRKGLLGCEQRLKKVFGGVLVWRCDGSAS